ncbi:MAG: DUF1080 domain-containing protein [Verrucomicrobiota bacterium]
MILPVSATPPLRSWQSTLAATLLLATGVDTLATRAAEPVPGVTVRADGWVPMTNGRDLSGWRNPFAWGEAKVVDGEIHLLGERKFFLVTEKTHGDFIFEGEVFLPPGNSNSGIMFRANVATNRVWGYQAEVDGDEKRNWSGGLYDEDRRMWFISPISGNAESIAAFRARAGEAFRRHDWNRYRITCIGRRLRIEVNGVVTTDVEDGLDAKGVIGLQHHGEKGQVYRFRNLRLHELGIPHGAVTKP